MKPYLLTLLSIMTVATASSQDLRTVNARAGFKDFCFSDKIASIQLFKTGDRFSDPVIRLNSDETLTLVFDELRRNDEREEDYFYTIEHRDARWNEENLITNDYMSGFPENEIDMVNPSQGTVLDYRNFVLTLPNENVRLKLSGNYFIKVFERDSGKCAFVKGFSIVEPLAAINVSDIFQADVPCMQRFELRVAYPSLKVIDAYRNITVRVERNHTSVPSVGELLPSFVYPAAVEYTRPDQNIHNGGNEYRAFDIRSLVYNGHGVARHSFDGVHRIELVQDAEQSSYLSARDINGAYMIGADNMNDPDTQSEYVDVLFSFVPTTTVEGRIFLFGEMTNRSLSDRYEMRYIDGAYRCIIPLKQGFYNYQYVILDNDGNPDMYTTEGCFYETENVYTIYIYYRLPEHRYDRLIGFLKMDN